MKTREGEIEFYHKWCRSSGAFEFFGDSMQQLLQVRRKVCNPIAQEMSCSFGLSNIVLKQMLYLY